VDLSKFIGDSIIVAHNASFDMGFLQINAAKANIEFKNNVIDTLQLCRKLYPYFENHKLDTICENLSINMEKYHRARNDARATAQIFFCCIKDFQLGEKKEA
jgi:DNA polymerase-3 subunit alpha (Gram-positive type)